MDTIRQATGRDVFGCRKQLKADGFRWSEELRAWVGDDTAVAKFQARGFRVKVFFQTVDVSRARI